MSAAGSLGGGGSGGSKPITVALPLDRVTLLPADAPRTNAIRVTLTDFAAGGSSTSMAWWKKRPLSPVRSELQRFELPELPTLDEAWTLWLFLAAERGEVDPRLEAMCRYVEDARQGRWTDRVPLETSVQAVYLSLAQESLVGRNNAPRYFEEAWALFSAVTAHLIEGKPLLDAPFVLGVPSLQRHVAALKDDHRLFTADLEQARRYEVRLPAAASITGGARTLKLLVLKRPAASQFKLWARRDGFTMLLVEQKDGLLVLSVDPTARVRLDAVAAPMTKADGIGVWYDGVRHDGTLIASSRDGTRLKLEDVVDVLGGWAKVRRQGSSTSAGVRAAVFVAAAGVMIAGVFAAVRQPHGAEAVMTGSKGDPIAPAQLIDLLASAEGPRSFTSYALVAGVCGYSGDRGLNSPCRDAREMRSLLIGKLGYAPHNILYLIDRPDPGEETEGPPTAANLRLQIEKFRARFSAQEQSSFLFYYSGHGGYEKGARKDYGVLQPSGYFEHPDQPMSDRGWDMQELLDGIRKGVPSRHVMVVLDACYSGWAVGSKGEATLSDAMHSLWKERAEVVITAGTKGQRAWEDEAEAGAWQWGGHSALTAFLLEGLGASGRPAADTNSDKVVTDEELARFLRARVPAAVRELKRSEQTPQFFRFDEQLPKSGQFIFIPKP
jgi:hypothetical protein